jgi:hypothetical protein
VFERPVESFWGIALVALGLPAYAWWRSQSRAAGAQPGA